MRVHPIDTIHKAITVTVREVNHTTTGHVLGLKILTSSYQESRCMMTASSDRVPIDTYCFSRGRRYQN
ncbi:hypothetical protein [Synechococcus sp. M16CYN]|uniref:hypothetical protein n=1 Tax=Synechococcus sp. M16CYN TaxID=3103139 RepID=UPI003342005D